MMETLEAGQKLLQSIGKIIEDTQELKAHEKVIWVLGLSGIFAEDYLSIGEWMRYAECGRPSAQKGLNTAIAICNITAIGR